MQPTKLKERCLFKIIRRIAHTYLLTHEKVTIAQLTELISENNLHHTPHNVSKERVAYSLRTSMTRSQETFRMNNKTRPTEWSLNQK